MEFMRQKREHRREVTEDLKLSWKEIYKTYFQDMYYSALAMSRNCTLQKRSHRRHFSKH